MINPPQSVVLTVAQKEIEISRRLIIATTIDGLNTTTVDHEGVNSHGHIQLVPSENLTMANYEQLTGSKEKPIMAKI
jgi:hypothetical protein